MTVYWIMYLIAVIAVVVPRKLPASQSRFVLNFVAFIFTLLIGLRYRVGGDWFNYLPIYYRDASAGFAELISGPDPAYHLLNWASALVDGGIYPVNLVCATLLMVGTVVFCRAQPNQWLALAVAIPYMLIVVGMGYTRQAVALGFALIGLTALGERRVRSFVGWVLIGALFHKSAVLLLPIAGLAASRNRWLSILLVGVTTVLAYFLLLADQAEQLWENYVAANLSSEGGPIRVAMNAVPAILLLAFRSRLVPNLPERRLWAWMALISLACIPIVGLASTAVDRIALYFIPLQLFVFSRIHRLASTPQGGANLVVATLAYYASVLFVWLNFATHVGGWVPYRFIPLW